jgi:CheY-like chemotaxis protein
MSAQRTALVIDHSPDVREMLNVVLTYDGYTVQTTADATSGLQVLRDSATPVTVLFDVLPMPGLSHEQSGLTIFDALTQASPDTEGLARHGYVLMSTNPEQALATVARVPAGLRILPKPFSLENLRASLVQVDEWLLTHPVAQPFIPVGHLGHSHLSLNESHRLLGEALERLQRGAAPPDVTDEKAPGR